jgi:hypothetical protein
MMDALSCHFMAIVHDIIVVSCCCCGHGCVFWLPHCHGHIMSYGRHLPLCGVVVVHPHVTSSVMDTVCVGSVLRSGSVRFFAPKTRNRGPQPVQDRPRYWGDRTGPPRTGLLRSTQPKQTSSDRFFGVIFVVPIEIIYISTIITLKIKRVI